MTIFGLDAKFLIGLAIGAVISIVCSWLVAEIYFRRISRNEVLTRGIVGGLQKFLLPVVEPNLFSEERAQKCVPESVISRSKGVPYLECAFLHPKVIASGDRVDIALKIVDLDGDLENPGGIYVRDHNNTVMPVSSVGLGYCKSFVIVEQTFVKEDCFFTIELSDKNGHKCAQTIRFPVEGKRHARLPT